MFDQKNQEVETVAISLGILEKPGVNHATRSRYFEQVQGNNNYYWDRTEVLQKLYPSLTAAFADVSGMSEREQVTLREAAYLIADRTARACRDRGWV